MKTKEGLGLLKTANGELVSSGVGISIILNDHFLTVFTYENVHAISDSGQIFSTEESELADNPVNKEMLEKKGR